MAKWSKEGCPLKKLKHEIVNRFRPRHQIQRDHEDMESVKLESAGGCFPVLLALGFGLTASFDSDGFLDGWIAPS
jgi:hypothetical protein